MWKQRNAKLLSSGTWVNKQCKPQLIGESDDCPAVRYIPLNISKTQPEVIMQAAESR